MINVEFNSLKKDTKKGFTLVELLVVISIIGLLSSIVLASLISAREKSRYAKAYAEIDQFIRVAMIAQGESNQALRWITGSGCSACACTTLPDMRGDTGTCYTNWINAITKIQNATDGLVTGIDNMKRDPWGSPYGLDENEDEGVGCRIDYIRTVGPDGKWNTGDDFGRRIPLLNTC